jgi:AcrR family transcriptional regulator
MAVEEPGMRNIILEKAKCLFIEHGYHGLSMREIAEQVGVSKPALYYHFKDKEELFCAILNVGLEELGKRIEQIQLKPVSNDQKIREFMDYVLTQPAEQRAVIRLGTQEMAQLGPESRQRFNESYHKQFTGRLSEMIKAGMICGEFKEMDLDIATWSLMGLMYPYLYPNQFGYSLLTQEKVQLIISIFMDGIKKP